MTAPPVAVATKDMWVVNLIEPWKGDSNSISATEFFESINEAAEMGHLSSKDKVRIARLVVIIRVWHPPPPTLFNMLIT